MSHKLTADTSVTYNAESQTSGVLVIEPEQIVYECFDNTNHLVNIIGRIKSGNTQITSVVYQLSNTAWNTFFAAQTLSSSTEYDKQLEAALLYIKQEIDGSWGLTSSNWTYSNS